MGIFDAYADRPIDDPSWCCDRCGYQLHGLLPARRCPECGTRCQCVPGTAWQLYGEWSGYRRMMTELMRNPLRVMRQVRSDAWGDRSAELVWGHGLASVAVAAVVPVSLAWAYPDRGETFAVAWAGSTAVAAGVVLLSLWVCRLLARLMGLRAIGRPMAAHASAGWLVGAVLAAAGHGAIGVWAALSTTAWASAEQALLVTLAAYGTGAGVAVWLCVLGMSRTSGSDGADDRATQDVVRGGARAAGSERAVERVVAGAGVGAFGGGLVGGGEASLGRALGRVRAHRLEASGSSAEQMLG